MSGQQGLGSSEHEKPQKLSGLSASHIRQASQMRCPHETLRLQEVDLEPKSTNVRELMARSLLNRAQQVMSYIFLGSRCCPHLRWAAAGETVGCHFVNPGNFKADSN